MIQETLVQTSLNQGLPILAPLVPLKSVESDGGQPGKYAEQVKIASPSKILSIGDKFIEFTNKNADVQLLHKLVLLLDSSFVFIVNVMKPLHGVLEANTTWFATYHPHYKKKLGTTKFTYNPFLLQSFLKLISLLNVSFDYVVKFATHHLHCKDIIGNPT